MLEEQYQFFQRGYGQEDIFEKVDGKGFKYFYFGNIARSHAWICNIEFKDKNIFFCVSQIMV